MQIKLANDASLNGLRPIMQQALKAAAEFIATLPDVEQEVVITCGTNGEHSTGSWHYYGLALDLRTRHLQPSERYDYSMHMERCLPEYFDVVLHSTHLHVECDRDKYLEIMFEARDRRVPLFRACLEGV